MELILPLAAFAFATSITPGPNNLMLMASGANFGIRRTVPHMLGVGIGFGLMVVLVGLGVMRIFEAAPWVQTVLRAAGLCYVAWLAISIARAAAPEEAGSDGTPFSFTAAAAVQWINPKAWAMALTAIA
ncbi:MAG: LysE family translocator, partial [Pseudomonadota bacterium]